MRGVAYFINFKWETKDTVFYSSLFFNQDSRGAAMYNKRAKKKKETRLVLLSCLNKWFVVPSTTNMFGRSQKGCDSPGRQYEQLTGCVVTHMKGHQ